MYDNICLEVLLFRLLLLLLCKARLQRTSYYALTTIVRFEQKEEALDELPLSMFPMLF